MLPGSEENFLPCRPFTMKQLLPFTSCHTNWDGAITTCEGAIAGRAGTCLAILQAPPRKSRWAAPAGSAPWREDTLVWHSTPLGTAQVGRLLLLVRFSMGAGSCLSSSSEMSAEDRNSEVCDDGSAERLQEAVRILIQGLGEDVSREGLRDTPKVSSTASKSTPGQEYAILFL